MRWKELVSWGLYPVVLFGSLGLALAFLHSGIRFSFVVMALVVFSTIPVLIAQRFLPAVEAWRGQPRDFSVDLLHMATTAGATELFRVVSLGVLYEAAGSLSAAVGHGLWPLAAPWLVQFALGLVIGEFFAYWLHRAFHTVPFLWRIHAAHHSSERMYVFAAARNHPMNVILMHACHVLPAALLGAPTEVIALCGVFTGVHGMLQHCNVDLKHGWLNEVFATADLHRWHHSVERAESNANFGNNLIVWDRLFGTRSLPEGRPARVGLDDGTRPVNYLWHLASPVLLYRAPRR